MKSGKLFIFVSAGIAITAVCCYLFWPDIAKYAKMRRQQRFLDERIAEEEKKGMYLKKEQEALAQDPVQIERVAREKLGMSRPKEIIYKFDEEAAPQPEPLSRSSKKEGKTKN